MNPLHNMENFTYSVAISCIFSDVDLAVWSIPKGNHKGSKGVSASVCSGKNQIEIFYMMLYAMNHKS